MGGKVKNNISDKRPYKVYTAILTQTGTNAPIATELENTLGNVVWSREGSGSFRATKASSFFYNKTYVSCVYGGDSNNFSNIYSRESEDYIDVINYNVGGVAVDNLENLYLEIRVYE